MTGFDDEVLQMYVEESREHLSNIESDLLAIEESGENIDEEIVNKVFRAAHSLKGGAGFLNLIKIKELAHKIENVLDMVRSRELVPNPEIINILLLAFDRLRDLVNNVQESNDAEIDDFVASLTSITTGALPKGQKETTARLVEITLPDGTKVMEVPEFDLSRSVKTGHNVYLMEFDLIRDVHDAGKTPLELVNNLLDGGTILNAHVDVEAVGNLDDSATQIPLYVLYATIIDRDMVGPNFDISTEKVHEIQITGAVPTEAVPPKQAPSLRTEDRQAPVPEPVQAAEAVPEKQVPEPAERREEKPLIADDGAKAKAGGAAVLQDTTLRVNVNLLETLMNLAGELVLSRNQLIESIGLNDQRMIKASGQRINLVTYELQEAIMLTRMQEIGNIFNKFPRVVRDLARNLGKEIRLDLSGKEVEMDKTIIEALSDPLTHLVRNAVDHGVELPDVRIKNGKNPVGVVTLKAYHEAGQVNIEIRDDGKGIDPKKIAKIAVAKGLMTQEKIAVMTEKEMTNLIMLPGFSTAEQITEVSGRGVGMDVVKTNLDKLGGQVEIDSELGKGTTFRIKLPLTLAIIPCLLVSVGGERFAIPQVNVEELIRVSAAQVREKIEIVGDAEVLILRGRLIPIVHLADVLGFERTFVDPETGERKADRRSRIADRRGRKSPFRKNGGGSEEAASPGERGAAGNRDETDRRYHAASDLNIAVVTAGSFQYGVVVEDLHDTVEIVVKPLGKHIKHLRQYAGATIMGDGRVALILDVVGLAAVAQLSSLSASTRAEELSAETARDRYQDSHSFLLFRNGPLEHCAVSVNIVERVEKITAADIETMGGTRVLQYRGQSMPLVTLGEVADVEALPQQNEYIVIVFRVADRDIGLLATPPVDTVDTKADIDQSTLRQRGIMGSAIIEDHTTLILDVYEMVDALHPEWSEKKAVAEPSSHNSGGKKKKEEGPAMILLAEDSDFFRSQVKRFLEEGGYSVVAAEDGLIAWERIQEHGARVSLVVTDIEMPRMDGYALTKNIKGDERFSHLPVIALTSLAGDEDITKGKAAGIDSYQVKLDRDRLLEEIGGFLRRN